jgi:ubiquinone/menaquinone biosynthesis C-methylase UbiE
MNKLIGKYSAVLKSRGGLMQTIRRHGLIRLLDAGLRETWVSLGVGILRLLGRHPGKGYGWLEAVLFPRCDYWLRYAQVVEGLEASGVGEIRRLIEVSSGRGGVAWIFRKADFQICLVDRSPDLLRDGRGGKAWRVCADACRLPFPDDSFDAAVSLDTVEHLPTSLRTPFLQELRRVTKRALVLTCPLQSGDGEFQGREFDLQLYREIAQRKGVQPEWLEEHIERGHPTREALREQLPGATVKGSENCMAWVRFSSLYERTFFWPFAGIFYLAFLKKRDTGPPYRRALLVYKKSVVHDLASMPDAANVPQEVTPA